MSLPGKEWAKHPTVTGPDAPCIVGIDYLRDPEGYLLGFGVAAVELEDIKELSALPGLSEDPSVVGLLRVEERQVRCQSLPQQCTGSNTTPTETLPIPIYKLIRQLES